MTYVTCDICEDISGLMPMGSMLIAVIAEYAMGIILVTEIINYANLMSSSRMRFFFPKFSIFPLLELKEE